METKINEKSAVLSNSYDNKLESTTKNLMDEINELAFRSNEIMEILKEQINNMYNSIAYQQKSINNLHTIVAFQSITTALLSMALILHLIWS